MGREFTSREARSLLWEHEELLRRLEALAALPEKYAAETGTALKALTSGSGLEDLILGKQPGKDPLSLPGGEALAAALYRYRKNRYTASSAAQLLALQGETVRKALAALNPGTGGLKWLFAPSGDKNGAALAYRQLTDLLNGGYRSSVLGMAQAASLPERADRETVRRDAESSPADYRRLLAELAPESGQTGRVRAYAALLEKLKALNGRIDACRGMEAREREEIKAAALRLTAGEARAILKEVPVEELSRLRSGIRVKTLRDNGFTTVGDIQEASVFRLTAINGISEEGAYALKQAAGELAQRAGAQGKIRLSADERTPEATVLVKAIYAYRRKEAARSALSEQSESGEARLKRDRAALEAVGSGAPWLFFTQGEREAAQGAYWDLSALLNGDYASRAGTLLSTLEKRETCTEGEAWADFTQYSIGYSILLEELLPGCMGGDSLYGLPEDLAREIGEEEIFPQGLLCTLRRYQEWGVKYILHQERVLLGDEMGLGKTVQAIAAMVSLRNTGETHFLVVCPASVVTNWCREIEKHSRLPAVKIHGQGRHTALEAWKTEGGVGVTTYETTRELELEEDFRFSLLVVDEAHYIKNPEARRTVSVKRLCTHAERLLFMTGTALENRVDEMIGLIRILQPQVAEQVRGMAFMATAPRFRERVAPVYYRRKREDVLTELPDLVESPEWCTLTPEEERVYEETVLSRNYAAVRRVSWNVGDLRRSSKARRLLEILEEAEREERKVIVFSFFLDTIRDIGALLGDRCCGPINGSVPPGRRQELVDGFEQAPAGSVLLAQIQSGGTGLNIQSASVVVICEPQFKPSIENQAISRAYRMGQARNVLVYRLLCENTADEHIMELLQHKQAVFDAFADESAAAERSVELDEKGFGDIISEEIRRIRQKYGDDPAL